MNCVINKKIALLSKSKYIYIYESKNTIFMKEIIVPL